VPTPTTTAKGRPTPRRSPSRTWVDPYAHLYPDGQHVKAQGPQGWPLPWHTLPRTFFLEWYLPTWYRASHNPLPFEPRWLRTLRLAWRKRRFSARRSQWQKTYTKCDTKSLLATVTGGATVAHRDRPHYTPTHEEK
jgi:hypothetical protein